MVSGDLRLPRGPARRGRPSKAQHTSQASWTGRRARRRAAERSRPSCTCYAYRRAQRHGGRSRRGYPQEEAWEARAQIQFQARPFLAQNTYFYIFCIFCIFIFCIFCILCILLFYTSFDIFCIFFIFISFVIYSAYLTYFAYFAYLDIDMFLQDHSWHPPLQADCGPRDG